MVVIDEQELRWVLIDELYDRMSDRLDVTRCINRSKKLADSDLVLSIERDSLS